MSGVRTSAQNSAVIARLDRAIQYAAASRPCSGASGILDPRLRGDDKRGRGSTKPKMFDLAELERAHEIVGQAVPPTPAHAWPLLAQRLGDAVVVKHENHTPIGAFKVRGGLVYLDRLKRDAPNMPGIISATRGNHGQSLAFAAGRHGVPAVIYVPQGNSVEKNRAMRAFGAELVEHGEDFQAAARRSPAPRAVRRPAHGAVVPSGSRARRRDLCARIVACGARSRRALCADRAGLGHLRLHHGARPARAAKPKSSACNRPKRRPMRCRLRPARW